MTHIRVKEYLFELLRGPSAPQAAHDERPPAPERLGEAHGQQRRVGRAQARRASRGAAPASLAQDVRLPGDEQVERQHRPVEDRDPQRRGEPVAPVAPEDEAAPERVEPALQRRRGAERRAVAVQRECRRDERARPAGAPQPQGEVDVLPVGEERGIEAAGVAPRARPVRRRAAARPGGRPSSRGRRRARSSRGPTSRRSRRAPRRPSRPGRDAAAGSGRPRPCPRRGPRTARPSARRSPGRGRRRC